MVIELRTWTINLESLHDRVFKAGRMVLREEKPSINFLISQT